MQRLDEGFVINPTISDYFTNHYDALLRNAMRITSSNRALSEDLLHDVFLRCSKMESLPTAAQEFQHYVSRSVQNGYISFLRRESRSMSLESLAGDDGSFRGLMTDPRMSARLNDEIFAICTYACERKETSIAASIVILRFIHGYFSVEVARLLNRSINAVEARLTVARREMVSILQSRDEADSANKLYLRPPFGRRIDSDGFYADIVNRLRQYVFDSMTGRCFSTKDLKRIYRQDSRRPEREEAGHLVSCRDCLERAGRLLKLPDI